MARPIKTGLEYFSVDTEWDRKMKIFKAKYKLFGVGLITELWKAIYTEGYFYPWDEDSRILFANEHGLDPEQLEEMMDFAIAKGIFDTGMYSEYRILTSQGIQKRYLNSCLKRSQVIFHKEYLLIEPKKPKWSETEIIIVSINNKKESETPDQKPETLVKNSKSTQSIESKESKVKNSSGKSLSDKIRERNLIFLPFAKCLFKIQIDIDPDFKPRKKTQNLENMLEEWANDFRLLIETDKRSPPVVKDVLTWLKNGSGKEQAFWRRTISSASGFRRNFPTMYRQYKEIAEKEMMELEEEGYIVEDDDIEFREEAES